MDDGLKSDTDKNHQSTIPTEWPGAFKIYSISKAAIMSNIGPFLSLLLIYVVFVLIFSGIERSVKSAPALDMLRLIYELFALILSSTLIYGTLQSVKGNKFSVGSAYEDIVKKAIKIVLTGICLAIISGVSLLLLIIPFFFIVPRVYLALFFVIDQDLSPPDAIRASWDHTKGHVGKVYGIIGVTILIVLPIITVVGIIATVYF